MLSKKFRWPVPSCMQCLMTLSLSLIASLGFAATDIDCQFSLDNSWSTGAIASVVITNTSSSERVVDDVSLEFTDGTRIGNAWNALVSGNNPYTLTPFSWSSTLGAGQSLVIGMQLSSQGGVADPVLGGLCGGNGGDENAAPQAAIDCVLISTLEVGAVASTVLCSGAGSSDPDGDVLSYRWDFGDGNQATGVEASHEYLASSLYVIDLTVSDGSLASQVSDQVQIVLENFDCAFTGLEMVCDVSGVDDVGFNGYTWDFGDGGTGAGSHVEHRYAAEGEYEVSLIIFYESAPEVTLRKTYLVSDGGGGNQLPRVTLGPVEGMQPGDSQNFSAAVSDPDGDLQSWSLSVYLQTIDGWKNQVILDSGNSAAGVMSVELAGSWSTLASAGYVVVASATDSHGETVSESTPLTVDETPNGTIKISVSDVLVVGEGTSAIATSWHPTNMSFSGLSIRVDPSPSFMESSISSSSGGAGVGYTKMTTLNFTPAVAGAHTITATDSVLGIQTTEVIEVLPVDSGPTIVLEGVGSAVAGDLLSFTLTGSSPAGASALSLSIGSTSIEAISSTRVNDKTLVNAYQWLAVEGVYTLTAEFVDNSDQTAVTNAELIVETAQDSGECASVGVDIASVNHYPDWPNLDWQGQPNNANTGDLMAYNGSVYRARWWTTSVPGSDPSWAFVCEI